MNLRRLVALLALTAIVAASCGDDDDDSDATGTATTTEQGAGEAGQVAVDIDADTDEPNAFFFAYFPDEVRVHPGDTVVYRSNFTGEPHSITFGTFIQPAIKAVENATPEQLAADEPPPEFQALFPYSMLPEGPGDANQVSANPCFVVSGEMPKDTTKPCEVREPAPFTGQEVFYNSGFLPDGETFEVELADDITPGSYQGFCMLHLTEMISTITVVPEAQDVPSADEVTREAEQQRQALLAHAEEHAAKAEAGAKPGEVLAGDPPEEEGAEEGPPKPNTTAGIAQFTPAEISVKSGESVTWNVNGPHTVSFNAPEDARVFIQKDSQGNTHVVEKALAPAIFNVPPPPEGEPEGPPPTVDVGSWDGTGFASTGFTFGGGFKVTFTKPGTYQYACLIHPDMEGTVTVT